MPKRSSKPSDDENAAAHDAIVYLTGGTKGSMDRDELRRQAAAILGSMGGKKGGPARAKSLSKARRSAIAKQAAKARWKGKRRK
jgi:hypothetical protein